MEIYKLLTKCGCVRLSIFRTGVVWMRTFYRMVGSHGARSLTTWNSIVWVRIVNGVRYRWTSRVLAVRSAATCPSFAVPGTRRSRVTVNNEKSARSDYTNFYNPTNDLSHPRRCNYTVNAEKKTTHRRKFITSLDFREILDPRPGSNCFISRASEKRPGKMQIRN